MTRLATAAELAEVLQLTPAAVLDKWEHGELPGYKIGRKKGSAVRFDIEEVLAACRRDAFKPPRTLELAASEE